MTSGSNPGAEARRRRLAAARAKLSSAESGRPLIRQRERGSFPLSSSQRRLWFLDQVVPQSLVYQVPAVVHLQGALDVDALEVALGQIFARHEVLRSHIEQRGAEAVAVVDEDAGFRIDRQSVRSNGSRSAWDEGLKSVNEFVRTPFDLESGPLFRVLLVDLGNDDWLLAFLFHHIVCEAWSIALLFDELRGLYSAARSGAKAQLDEPEFGFGDFACWEREALDDPDVQTGIRYWKERLADIPPVELPTDRPRPPTQTQNGHIIGHRIDAEDVDAVQRFASEHEATPFIVTLSAFFALVYRMTGEGTMAVGCPVSSRDREELQKVVGFFVNTLVMRGDLDETTTTSGLVRDVKSGVLDGFSHQSAPFELIVDELNIPRDLSRNPLFQLMFAFQNTPLPALTLAGLSGSRVLTPEEVHSGTSKVDLSVIIEPVGDEWIVWAEYNTDLFDSWSIESLLENYHALLLRMAACPDVAVADLDFLPEHVLEKMLVEWNETARPGDGRSIVRRFRDAAAAGGDRTAVRSSDDQITYSELDHASDDLARRLRDSGVGKGDVVAVFLPRSVNLVVAELAVLKLGAAYVPIDPNYPDDRVQFMVADSAARLTLTGEELLDRLDGTPAIVVTRPTPGSMPSARLDEIAVEPGDLAYIVYTSGSTGRPKGVEVEHRGLENFVDWQCDCHQLSPEDVYAMVVSPAFDASVWEIWPTLASGATISVADDETRIMADQLVSWLVEEKVTITFLPTPLAEAVLAQEWPDDHSMRSLLTGGEALHPVTRTTLPCRLFNHYGPTENTVITTVCEVFPGSSAMPPIGRPIRNVEAYILDSRLRPVPPGAVGELCLSGQSVARGYRNRPDLTAEVFIENPIGRSAYRRMYRTGDLCRFDADGNIHFVGRRDRQVKIRGYRVELGEIESSLLGHDSIRECAVSVHTDAHTRQPVLVAYVAAKNGMEIRASDLRKALNVNLPQFMIPQIFVELDALPRTKNGKIDRRGLPEPEGRSAGEREVEPPANDLERLMAQAWSEVLGVSDVSATDNFFDLGGNSLLAIQVVHKLRDAGGMRINPLVLFSGTLRQAAAAIEESVVPPAASDSAVWRLTGSIVARVRKLVAPNRS